MQNSELTVALAAEIKCYDVWILILCMGFRCCCVLQSVSLVLKYVLGMMAKNNLQ